MRDLNLKCLLRSKKGHNKISPKNRRTSQAQKEKIQAKPKAIDTDDPWGNKRKAQGILKPRKKKEASKKETTTKHKEARILNKRRSLRAQIKRKTGTDR